MNDLLSLLTARWKGLARREQHLLLLALAALLSAMLWWVGLAPALATLRAADAQHRMLDAEIQQMRNLQAQAKALQAHPKMAFDEARRQVEASVKQHLGATAQLAMAGEQMRLTFKGASAEALAQWLEQARLDAHAVPVEAHLMHSAAGPWDGMLLLNLGAQ
jgi:general secretion pathway protein M